MFTTLESKGILRSAPEEFMHAALYKPHDELSGEFIRTFRHRYFWGAPLLKRYESLQSNAAFEQISLQLPKQGSHQELTDSVTVVICESLL